MTVLVPLVAPKLMPLIVTDAPTGPFVGSGRHARVGDRIRHCGAAATVRRRSWSSASWHRTICRGDHIVGEVVMPLKVAVLVPLVALKAPAIVTMCCPLVGVRLVTLGIGASTVNPVPLLATLPTVTTTFPVVAVAGTGTTMLVADQVPGVARIPLMVTLLVPLVAPKLVPVIVTDVPTGPLVRVVTLGATTVTVNAPPLPATSPTSRRSRLSQSGTGTTMSWPTSLGVAFSLKVTLLVPWSRRRP